MNARRPLYSSTHAGVASVEWEELPSLPSVLLRRHVPQASYAIASELVLQAQARLYSAPASAPVFRHFFGAGSTISRDANPLMRVSASGADGSSGSKIAGIVSVHTGADAGALYSRACACRTSSLAMA